MNNNRVFLIGFMGVGKSTIGKKLAKRLSIPFIDLDEEIENKFELSINDFFSRFGEVAFREEETKMLENVINEYSHAIISVGGGLPCYNKNMERMNAVGKTCYLHRPPKELFQRLVNSKESRPLLKDIDDIDLLKFIKDKLLEREGFYSQAKYTLTRNQQEVQQIIEILELG